MLGCGEEWCDSVGAAYLGYILWKLAWLGMMGFAAGGGMEYDAGTWG